MKKSMLIAALAALALSATVARADNMDGSSGLYLGAYGGYDWSSADTGVAGVSPDVDGFDGGLFVGYKLHSLLDHVNHLGIGLNAALQASYGWSNADGSAGGVLFEKESEWGVSLRPGFDVLDAATSSVGISPYAILGYRNTKFEATALGITASERYDGFELGLGAELMAHKNIGVRLEYTHTWYGSEGGVDPDSDDLRAGVAFHF
ncbi:MAG TPA: porin family protein [Patescibacteria group bacterium]|nr:porin family protein [Patescibacteria group bacterium]